MMLTTYSAIIILLVLDIAVLLVAHWFDQRYYMPFLDTTINKTTKEPGHKPNLFGAGVLTTGGGLLIWTLIGCICIWFYHK